MIVVPQLAFRGERVAMGDELPPVRLVRDLIARGAREVSLLDLDGEVASETLPQWLEALVAVAGVPVRLDARLHEGSRIERVARAGLASVVVDQSALFEPMLLRWALDLYGDRLVVEVQVDGEYVFDPPAAAFGRELVDVLADLHFQGVRRVLYRDIGSEVVPLDLLRRLGDRLGGVRFSYQGAARTVGDVAMLRQLGPLLEAVLIDARRILDGELDLADANRAAAPRR